MVKREHMASRNVQIALHAAGQAMYEYNADTDRIAWADPTAAAALLGCDDVDGFADPAVYESAIETEHAADRRAILDAAMIARRGFSVEYQINCGSDSFWVEERGTWLSFGDSDRLIAIVRRIDDQKQREHQLSYMACYDELTGLLNRMRFKEELDATLDRVAGAEGKATLFLIGIDDVGSINSDFGFEAADEVILKTGRRISDLLCERSIMGRVAGTKFAVLLPTDAPEAVRQMSRQILNGVRAETVNTSSGSLGVSVCIGAVYLTPEHNSAGNSLSQAEAAFDDARLQGRSSFTLFCETTETVSRRRRNTALVDNVLTALNEDRIYLAYQPIAPDITTEQHTSYECLIRMRDATGREVPAPAFIPAAEELGLVHLLDRRVLELATATLAGRTGLHLNVNLSWETVRDPVWAESYLSHLRAMGQVCPRLTIELTETQMVEDVDPAIEFVSEIKDLGCRFAIDDFGAGYTSFRNLKALDIDVLKIDGSFISGVSGSRENQLFVRTLLDLARNFGVSTVAEWVDNEADARLLKALGVDRLQGFYIGRPNPLPEAAGKHHLRAVS